MGVEQYGAKVVNGTFSANISQTHCRACDICRFLCLILNQFPSPAGLPCRLGITELGDLGQSLSFCLRKKEMTNYFQNIAMKTARTSPARYHKLKLTQRDMCMHTHTERKYRCIVPCSLKLF